MNKPTMSRRTVLRGACGATIALPFLEAMGWGQVAGPKRLILMATTSGTGVPRWRPSYDPAGKDSLGRVDAKITKMSDMLAPLEPLKEKIIQLRGVALDSAFPRDDGHYPGKRVLFTNLRPDKTNGPNASASLDQVIANKLAGTTKFKSVDLGVGNAYGEFFSYGPGKNIYGEKNPKKTFDLLFRNLKVDPNDPAVLQQKARRQSMLDTVKANYGRLLAKRLGKEDHLRVESHLESLRELERSTNFMVSGACSGPDVSGAPDKPANGAPYWASQDAQYDIIEKTLACDLARVVSLEIGDASGANIPYKFGGTGIVNGDYHGAYSHAPPDNPGMATIQNAHAEHLARFLGKLDAIKEGDRTALDNTILVWGSEVGSGDNHTVNDIAFLLAGSAGGYFKMGRFIDYCTAVERARTPDGRLRQENDRALGAGGISHGQLLVSLLNAMGIEAQTFGNPQFSKGPAPGLT